MENTPSRIAADILCAAIAANKIAIHQSSDDALSAVFTTIHAAAKKDYDSSLSNPNK